MMIQSFQGALGFMPGGKSIQQDPAVFGGQPATQAGESQRVTPDIRQIAKNLRNYLRSEGLDKQVIVRVDQRGVTVSLSDQFLFDSSGTSRRMRVFQNSGVHKRPVPHAGGHIDSVLLKGEYTGTTGVFVARRLRWLHTQLGILTASCGRRYGPNRPSYRTHA